MNGIEWIAGGPQGRNRGTQRDQTPQQEWFVTLCPCTQNGHRKLEVEIKSDTDNMDNMDSHGHYKGMHGISV